MRRSDELPDALDHLDDELLPRLRPRPAVFLDFDGTLSPIVTEPGAAAPLPALVPLVARLARAGPVALISGRGLDDLRARFDVAGLAFAGSHGFELRTRSGRRLEPYPEAAETLHTAAAALDRLARTVPGAAVERKPFAVTLHLRSVTDPVDLRRAETAALAIGTGAGLRATRGRRVVELHPPLDWHKGHTVAWFLDRWRDDGFRGPALYIGDDQTDEDAFRALRNRGLPILVRPTPPRPTAARWSVADPAAVLELLRRMADALDGVATG